MFFQLKDTKKSKTDSYDQVLQLVTAILHQECPHHSSRHHLLYTANLQLEQYKEAKDFFYAQCDVTTSLGTFSKEAYDKANKNYHQLYLLIRAYMHLSDERQREHFNHHFRFSKEQIETMYNYYEHYSTHVKTLALEEAFWHALKEDLAPLLTQLE